jgi:multidrug efflux pump subunit AcrA (membrane-fusion protein)
MRFEGRVERLREQLNPETRTVQAVIHVPNRAGRLRPGMFASVRLATPAGTTVSMGGRSAVGDSLLTVPESAVISDGDQRITFVEVAPRIYARREVEVTSLTPPGSSVPSERRLAVRAGLRPGDRVVVEGAFTLKSELAKAALGEHGH